MKTKERILHAVLFELGALVVGALVVKWISHDADNGAAFTVACVLAVMAMCLNFLFNFGFDKILTGKREARGALFRVFHTVAFETFLLMFTLPVVAYILQLSWWHAFLADIGMTLAVMVYAFFFNWLYDHIRLRFI